MIEKTSHQQIAGCWTLQVSELPADSAAAEAVAVAVAVAAVTCAAVLRSVTAAYRRGCHSLRRDRHTCQRDMDAHDVQQSWNGLEPAEEHCDGLQGKNASTQAKLDMQF